MGSESIANEAEGLMGYWLRGHEIQLAGQKFRDKNAIQPPLFWFSKQALYTTRGL